MADFGDVVLGVLQDTIVQYINDHQIHDQFYEYMCITYVIPFLDASMATWMLDITCRMLFDKPSVQKWECYLLAGGIVALAMRLGRWVNRTFAVWLEDGALDILGFGAEQ
ncbi:hypothetical protein NA57DRAFT_71891 [Rhizodiscina lignyota]|uniref:Uncharacterized protein n=1 Tax=Rhizodiscina lignyota TaxID=1504668 RepID=A0A9P4IN75_9PEZI|nr:hypothetical protein NA57DRAFT_71891 [Rhizodiscina lignyota]